MQINLIGKRPYDFITPEGRKITGATLYCIVIDSDDTKIQGQKCLIESWASPKALNLEVGEDYVLLYDKLKDGKAKLAAVVPVE